MTGHRDVYAERFKSAAIRSGLVDPSEFKPIATPAVEHAELLVARKVLTRYQADKLLGGRWHGLKTGPFRLLAPLGRGGTGIVYLARDDRRLIGDSTPRLVALKVLSPNRAVRESRTLARFLREMDIGLTIPADPALTAVYETGVYDGIHFIAMEYVPGHTAKQTVVTSGPMSVAFAARVFADVATGLHAAHQSGFVHRDTKPANVMVTPSGRAKLLDFGFALRRGERANVDPTILGGKGYTLGTLDYLPPEQASNAVEVGAETDVYSIGCSLYFVLTGHPPHQAASARDKLRKHQTAEPTPIRSINPSVPNEFVALVSWMMSKRPENRPQSAYEVARLLERWAAPTVPIASRLGYDESWEVEVINRVEAAWLSRRITVVQEPPNEHRLPVAKPVCRLNQAESVCGNGESGSRP